jgi:glycosyltransferase involved in cell wall biosynthesis
MNPNRILFVADQLMFGGAERHLVSVATWLARRGNETSVAYLKPHEELLASLVRGGVTHVTCCNSRGGVDLRAIRRLAAVINKFRPEVLVVTSQYSLMFGILARLWSRFRVPVLFICHSMDHVVRSRKDRVRFAVFRHIYGMADRIVFVSELQRIFFHDLGISPKSEEVIHNGIDLTHFSASAVAAEADSLRLKLGFTSDDFVVGICAAFREEKRHIDLLEAVSRLRKVGVSAKILMVGDGPMRSQIEACRDALGLQDAVVLAGHTDDVRPFVTACDVMALTSHAETFPISTLECMALGKPIVVSDVGGVREQIDDQINGLLYPAGDIDSLVSCLLSLVGTERRVALGKEARRAVESRFSVERMMERFLGAFSLLATGPSS